MARQLAWYRFNDRSLKIYLTDGPDETYIIPAIILEKGTLLEKIYLDAILHMAKILIRMGFTVSTLTRKTLGHTRRVDCLVIPNEHVNPAIQTLSIRQLKLVNKKVDETENKPDN